MKDLGGGGGLEFVSSSIFILGVFLRCFFCISLILFGSKDEMSLYLWLMSAEGSSGWRCPAVAGGTQAPKDKTG